MRPGESEFEDFKVRELKARADCLAGEITSGIPLEKFREEERELRDYAQKIFPDRLDQYDLIYRSRFKRIWEQFRSTKVDF